MNLNTLIGQQRMFDDVVSDLLKQGKPSTNEKKGCVYRGPGGTKCAAGHLIPDHLYSDVMEGKLIGLVVDAFAGLRDHLVATYGSPHYNLLSVLQQAHDDWAGQNAADIEVFKAKCRDIAEQYGLNSAVIDNPTTKGEPTA